MAPRTRKVTTQLIEMLADESLDPRVLAEACLNYMSEADVADMARSNDLLPDDEDSEDDED